MSKYYDRQPVLDGAGSQRRPQPNVCGGIRTVKPLIHAEFSVRRHGGTVEDYLPIHNFLDSSKSVIADMRHRALLHNAFGIYICEQMFGTYIMVDGGRVAVRAIAEEHVVEDLGGIPPVTEFFDNIPIEQWLPGAFRGARRLGD